MGLKKLSGDTRGGFSNFQVNKAKIEFFNYCIMFITEEKVESNLLMFLARIADVSF